MTDPAQTMAALRVAQDVRLRRAEEKQRIERLEWKDGRRAVAELLEAPPEWLEGYRLDLVLVWPKLTGPDTRRRVILALGRLAPRGRLTVGDLTVRQREAIAACLRGEE